MSPRVDSLDAEAICAALAGRLIGKEVLVLEETTSTNDFVAQLAPQHAEGLVVVAERQTAGRGQYGRRWESTRGKGLWLSILLRPGISVAESSRLTDLLAREISETITAKIGLSAAIKPPNDVYVDGRKVAGVLVEMRVETSGGYCAVAGLGINVNHSANDFPVELQKTAGSLAMAAGQPVDRAAFTIALLQTLDDAYRGFLRAR
ncbi:MAG: biotin--[acetyl-CoA-carboxylase] ligase [Chthoniobacterales bacterium]|nr:biotin--[acetyl-CoA-carboxylase] ligase [Chthoniobacterales bacterium]